MDISLSADQIAAFKRDGFTMVPRITTDEEVEWLRGVYDDLFGTRSGEASGLYFDLGGRRAHGGEDVLPQILGPESHRPELEHTIFRRNARKLAAQLLEAAEDAISSFGHMILKPPHYGRETPWHQDEAYWDPNVDHHGLSVWMPLEDATVESGCMQFVPGSHTADIREHRHIDHDPLVHGLQTDVIHDVSRAVAVPVPAGGASFHYCRIMHYAGPNTTDRARRAYVQIIQAPPVPRDVPHERPWQTEAREAVAKLLADEGTLARRQS